MVLTRMSLVAVGGAEVEILGITEPWGPQGLLWQIWAQREVWMGSWSCV